MNQFFNNPNFKESDANGLPYKGGSLYFYIAGTVTPQNTYPTIADAIALTNPNSNPIILNTLGEPTATAIVLSPGLSYKVILKDINGNTIWTLDNIKFDNGVYDQYGQTLLQYIAVASAVNYATITNATTGTPVTFGAAGSDSNIGIQIKPKGTGALSLFGVTTLKDINGNILLSFTATTSAVNYVAIQNAASGSGPIISPSGPASDIGLNTYAKGAGILASYSTSATPVLWGINGGNSALTHNIAATTALRTITWPDANLDFTGYTTPVPPVSPISVYCARQDAATTSLPDNTPTKMILGTALYDNHSYWDATNHRFTPLIAGTYQISASVEIGAATDQALVEALIYKNGTVVYRGGTRNSGTGTNGSTVSGILTLNGSTDYVELFAISSSGSQSVSGSINANFLTAIRISGI
jgi:hypothetical protein